MKVIQISKGVELIPEHALDEDFIRGLSMLGRCEVQEMTFDFSGKIRVTLLRTTGQQVKDITPQTKELST